MKTYRATIFAVLCVALTLPTRAQTSEAPSAPAPTASYTMTGPGVRNPGVYPLPDGKPVSLADAIGRAGGLSSYANMKAVYLYRPLPHLKVAICKLDCSKPKDLGDFLIRNGDSIVVSISHNLPYKPMRIVISKRTPLDHQWHLSQRN